MGPVVTLRHSADAANDAPISEMPVTAMPIAARAPSARASATHESVGAARERTETPTDSQERQWLPRHASGDRSAFKELMRYYGPAVMGYVVRCGVPPSLRDDVFQDVFFKIHRNASLYSPRHPLRPWLFTVTANVVRSHFRKQGVFQRYFSSKELEVEPSDSAPSTQVDREGREFALRLDRSIQRLPMKQREVLCLVCLEGMALDEVAIALSMPVNSVKTNLQRARKSLRRDLERHEKIMNRELER